MTERQSPSTGGSGERDRSADVVLSWEWCEHCEVWMLRCPKCRMNACSGGYGDLDGVECDICPAVYLLQDFYLNEVPNA